ncbi:efflux RND transporter periplasmic adaptor subunit [Roseimaritima multifibrata]|nr:efflux RND transporter periplasmic adaptor subunit [Roseimaritima multifibrata]
MLHKVPPPNQTRQKFIVTMLSVSMTMFLLGGALGYWAISKFRPAAAASAAGGGPGDGTKKKPGGRQAQLVRVGTIERKKIVPVKTLVGDLIAVRRATVATEIAGKVIELPVDEGSHVVAGETLLARMDDTWLKLEEAKINALITEKEATLAFEKTDLVRFEDLFKRNALSASEVEQKRSLFAELEASLANLKVALNEATTRNERLDIFAPFDGSVVAKNAEIGEYLPVGSPVVEIVSSGRIDARIMVPEASLPLIAVGDTLDMVIDSLGLELQGTVFSINAQGSVGSRTFPVRIELEDQKGKLRPGMGVSAFVPVTQESTELLVPRDAVLMAPDESIIWVLVEADSPASETKPAETPKSETGKPNGAPQLVAQPIPVRVLSHTRDAYAIACMRSVDEEHVQPGVQVVTEGLERLTPGTLVRIDADRSLLQPVPGTYRTGQQIAD